MQLLLCSQLVLKTPPASHVKAEGRKGGIRHKSDSQRHFNAAASCFVFGVLVERTERCRGSMLERPTHVKSHHCVLATC